MSTVKYQIEKDVPLSKFAKRKPFGVSYPIKKMSLNDSFVTEEEYNKQNVNRVRARLTSLKTRLHIPNASFSVAKDPNSELIRVWKTN